jgi:alkylated DNA repair protein (DNA oxidative demethylase)
MTGDLFSAPAETLPTRTTMGDGALLLHGFALPYEAEILAAIDAVAAAAPFRHMTTPGGFVMSVAMTSSGDFGWVTNRSGYRYDRNDPATGKPWPAMPESFRRLAAEAAAAAGYDGFMPDSCLVNRYEPGTRLSLHQDKDERDYSQPIVSVSLGLPAIFLFGGLERNAPTTRYKLQHGDVAVWGGVARLRYHGISPLKDGEHPKLSRNRINLTFRRAR